MRVMPTARERLSRFGVSMRLWRGTHRKLRELSAVRKLRLVEVIDQLVDEALQREYDLEAQELNPSDEREINPSQD